MSTGKQLIVRVRNKAKDPDVTDDEILEILSDAIDEIATRVLLPPLETTDTVTTSTSSPFVAMPSTYHRNLFRCFDLADPTRKIGIKNNRSQMFQTYGRENHTGLVRDVCVTGDDQLMYQGIPETATELTIMFHAVPDVVTMDAEVAGFNAVTRRKGERAMVEYAAFVLKEDIEQGIDGKKINTEYFGAAFERSIEALEAAIGEGQAYRDPTVVKGEFL